MSDQNPHPGDTHHSQIPVGCPSPPLPLGLDIDRCINVVVYSLCIKALKNSLTWLKVTATITRFEKNRAYPINLRQRKCSPPVSWKFRAFIGTAKQNNPGTY